MAAVLIGPHHKNKNSNIWNVTFVSQYSINTCRHISYLHLQIFRLLGFSFPLYPVFFLHFFVFLRTTFISMCLSGCILLYSVSQPSVRQSSQHYKHLNIRYTARGGSVRVAQSTLHTRTSTTYNTE
jgi:hypothetical protein